MTSPDIERDLRAAGLRNVTTSAFERRFYARDNISLPAWVDRLLSTMPLAVVKAENVEQVAAVCRYCCERNIPIVPRGAGTSGLFGSVPKRGGIVVDLQGLCRVTRIDVRNRMVEAEAGITCGELDRQLHKHNLALKSYPSSAPSATLGGWFMGSGEGIGTLLHGPMSNHVMAGELILADGTVKPFSASEGAEWVCGSEGALAVATRFSLAVRGAPDGVSHHLVHFPERETLFEFVRTVSRTAPVPYAVHIQPIHRRRVSDGRGKAQYERRAFPWFAGEVDCTIVHLHHAERHRQPDARSLLLRGEV